MSAFPSSYPMIISHHPVLKGLALPCATMTLSTLAGSWWYRSFDAATFALCCGPWNCLPPESIYLIVASDHRQSRLLLPSFHPHWSPSGNVGYTYLTKLGICKDGTYTRKIRQLARLHQYPTCTFPCQRFTQAITRLDA